MIQKLWPAACVILLSACAQTADYQRPELPVPADWAADLDVTGREDATRTHWQAFFTDPRLKELIAQALKNNRDLRIATARVAEARAQYGVVRSDRFPSLGLSGSGSFGATPADLSGTGTDINGQRYDLNLTMVSYELDFWGRLASLSEAARNNYLATDEARRAFALSLVSEVASAYFAVLQFETLERLAQSSVASRERTLAVVGKARDIGGTFDYEVLQVSAALESARAEQAALQQQLVISRNRLNYVVGAAAGDLPDGRDIEHQGLDADLAPGLPGEVLLARPDVIAAEQRLKAAHASVDAARAAFFPKVALSASAGVASVGLSTLFNGAAWTFAPVITMPLFDSGRLESGRDLVEARKVVAVAEYEKTIQLAFREVSDLLAARRSAAQQLRSAQFNTKVQQQRLEMVRARNQVGLTGSLEVLEAERALLSAKQSEVQLRRAQLESAAQLYKALGGGA